MIIINKLLKKITVLFICLTLLYSAYTQDRGNSSFGYPHASYASMRGLTPGTAAGGGGIMFEKAAVPKDEQTFY